MVVKTYNISLAGCPCCGVSACELCSFCDPEKTPTSATITFSGFPGWAASMNRSFALEIGDECHPTSTCELFGYWDGINCDSWPYPIWQQVRLTVFGPTEYTVNIFSPETTPDDPCASVGNQSGPGLTITFLSGGGPDFTSGVCDEPTEGSPLTLPNGDTVYNPGVSGSAYCASPGGTDYIDLTGVDVEIAILSTTYLPATLTMTFTGACASEFGTTVALTFDSGTDTYTGASAATCNIDWVYDPCDGSLAGTGDCTINGTSTVTDYQPFTATSTGLSASGGCACCDPADVATTTFDIA